MYEIIDFDARFAEFSEDWMHKNRSRFANINAMEDAMPEVYMRWLNAPADFLGGETPAMYFSKYNDPYMLINWIREYDAAGVSVPDQLLERISDIGEASVPALINALTDEDNPASVRMAAVNLLQEVETHGAPLTACLAIIDKREAVDELADVCAELVVNMGGACVTSIIERFEDVSDEARETYLDILCNFPGDERIYKYARGEFDKHKTKRALYASYLGKLGDARCIDALKRALEEDDINYLDYLEIINAIGMLGGEANSDREFAGDPYYEAFKGMGISDDEDN